MPVASPKKKDVVSARYAGTCASTGKEYSVGTLITKGPKGWQIAPGAVPIEQRKVRLQPLAVEYGGKPGDEPKILTVEFGRRDLFCSCCKSKPDFKEGDQSTYIECKYVRDGDALRCGRCGRTGEILSAEEVKIACPPPPPEERTCWECGRGFTYAECRRHGGDWSDNYCGC